jgi:NodT family efflux transporter outer membrane factor (OMF) lipoprotein
MTKCSPHILLTGVCVLLSSCTVGPKYVRPTVQVPASYKELTGAEGQEIWKVSQPGDEASRGKWWEAFHDTGLNALEAKLDGSNQTIAAASAAVLGARAVVQESRAQYFPTIIGGAGITSSRISTFGPVPAGVNYSQFSLPAQASWEPDLWGRVRNTVKASSLAAQASVADRENVRLAAQSDLAVDYFELRAQDDLKRLLDATTNAYREALELTRNRCDAGLESDEAVAQAEALWNQARAQDMDAGIVRAQYEHAIAVLIGQPAAELSLAPGALPAAAPAIPIELPSAILQRRPDVAAAERTMAQANAQIGIAIAAFYPNVTLTASGGFQNLSMAEWFTWPSRIWSVGTSLTQTLFDAGLRKATVRQYQASYDEAVANYRQTVLTAFAQVEDNLAALRMLEGVIERQEAAVQAAERTLREAATRYTSGLDPYLNVISAQTALLTDRQAVVSAREQQFTASVQLVKALGGGWTTVQMTATEPVPRHP